MNLRRLDTKNTQASHQETEQRFEAVFKAWFVRLVVYADRLVNDREDARELVQDVFLKVWDKRFELPLDDSLKAYLFRSVRNACFNFLQHKRVVNQYQSVLALIYLQEEEAGTRFDGLELSELEFRIQTALASLPAECHRIFLLSRDKGLKYAEIAAELNISVKTVETQMSRALSKLREQLKDYL